MNSVNSNQLDNLRLLGPEKRLRMGMQLSELVLKIAKSGIKSQLSSLSGEPSKDKVASELRRRIALKEETEKAWTKKRHSKMS